jgi:hypothetical protein
MARFTQTIVAQMASTEVRSSTSLPSEPGENNKRVPFNNLSENYCVMDTEQWDRRPAKAESPSIRTRAPCDTPTYKLEDYYNDKFSRSFRGRFAPSIAQLLVNFLDPILDPNSPGVIRASIQRTDGLGNYLKTRL